MRRLIVLVALLVVPVLLSAPAWAGGGGGGPCSGFQDASAGSAASVILRDNCLDPTGLVVDAGSEIRISNDGQVAHTFTAIDGSFDTGVLQPGDSAVVRVPAGNGPLPVYCTLHADANGAGMSGLLAVSASATDAGGLAVGSGAGSGGVALGALAGLALGAAGAVRFTRRRDDAEVA